MFDPTLQHLSPPEEEEWGDAKDRNVNAKSLMCDEMLGMLNMMTESMSGPEGGASGV